MAEENEVIESTVEELETEASGMGWTPKDQWKGDPARWVDAKTYVERSHTFVPFLQKAKTELQSQVGQLTAQIQQLTGELRAQSASMKAIEESHAEDLAAQLKTTKAEIGRQLKEAKQEGDLERELELIDQLGDLKIAEKDAEAAEKERKAAPPAERKPEPLSPEYIAWRERNAWIETDPKRARRAMLVAQEIAEDHQGKLTGKPFYDKLDVELKKLEGGAPRRPAESKVEGGRPRDGGGSDSHSYADLPADAKAVCDRQTSKLVGPGRAHKDKASWQASYAKQYFEMEQR